jgi:hypothetical protein
MNVQRIFVVIFLLVIIGDIVAIIFLPDSLIRLINKESGAVENIQVILYVIGALVSWTYARRRIWDNGYQGSLILLTFAMRELDFQKKFTEISMTRTKYYFHSNATLFSKIICALILISIIVVFVVFIKKNFMVFIQNVKAHKNWALSIFAGLLSMMIAIFVDSSLRNLELLGIEAVKHVDILKTAIEELFELAIPFFFLNALLLYGTQTKKTTREEGNN